MYFLGWNNISICPLEGPQRAVNWVCVQQGHSREHDVAFCPIEMHCSACFCPLQVHNLATVTVVHFKYVQTPPEQHAANS